MPAITFKAKPKKIYNTDGSVAYEFVKVPQDLARYVDKAEFRRHPAYDGYANSDLFGSILKRSLSKLQVGPVIRFDRLPECVTVDTSTFLATITIQVEGWR